MVTLVLLSFFTIWFLITFFIYRIASKYVFSEFIRKYLIFSHIFIIAFLVLIIVIFGAPHKNFVAFRWYFVFNLIFLLQLIFIVFHFLLYSLIEILIIPFRNRTIGFSIRKVGQYLIFVLIGFVWLSLLYGSIWGTTNFKVVEKKLYYSNLPESFDGFKILHISDAHLGSFFNKKSVKKCVDLINEQNFDVVIFSGDLINISPDESQPYIDLFKSIKAPHGKYAVLGNHDLSDYRKIDIKRDSLNVDVNKLVSALNQMGFVVLRDSCITIEKNNESIDILGVDNWGLPPFKPYGNLEKALNHSQNDFQVLISHDPSHWANKVKDKTNIELTLSGHTHGMQVGIMLKNFKWSFAKLINKYWLGLFENENNKNQKLYVNAGMGFIGIPVRLGIFPEIALIELKRK